MSEEPAKLVRLSDLKGPIKVGRDADFVIWNPDEEFVVDQAKLLFKNRLSPYHGESLFGKVARTIVRGKTVFYNSEVSTKPQGTPTTPSSMPSTSSSRLPLLCSNPCGKNDHTTTMAISSLFLGPTFVEQPSLKDPVGIAFAWIVLKRKQDFFASMVKLMLLVHFKINLQNARYY
jgi:hypothetical protein